MNISKLRARPWGTALLFFGVGVLFASAMDWTPFSHAQSSSSSRPLVQNSKSLEETGNAFVSIAEHVTPAVVSIQTRINARPAAPGQRNRGIDPRIPPEFRNLIPDGSGQLPAQEGTGSGFIISSDGYIVTNNHVVTAQDRTTPADKITVTLTNRQTYDAKLIGHDPQTDVAVIKIDGKNLPTAALGDDERLRIGEWVLAIGNPLGLDFTVTAGIVSAKGRNNTEVRVNTTNTSITDFIQTDAAINPGNSGGPLVNIRGEVVGINTAIASTTGMYAGYGFAIPVDLARTVWQDLIAHGHIVRAQLGVQIGDVTAEDAKVAGIKDISGVLVTQCNDKSGGPSPACTAGVQGGDVITALDGKPVNTVAMLQRIVRAKQPGDVVMVKLMRYGKPMDFRVRLTEMKPAEDAVLASAGGRGAPKKDLSVGAPLGIDVEPVSDEFIRLSSLPDRYKGLRITGLLQDGPATRIFPNDVIVASMPNHDPIRSEADLKKLLAGKKPGDVVSFEIVTPTEDENSVVTYPKRVVNLRVMSQ